MSPPRLLRRLLHSSDEDIDAEAEVLEQQGEVLEQSNSWPGKVLERFNSSRMAVLAAVRFCPTM